MRNHLTAVFDKIGVSSRSQAIVFARDRGLALPLTLKTRDICPGFRPAN